MTSAPFPGLGVAGATTSIETGALGTLDAALETVKRGRGQQYVSVSWRWRQKYGNTKRRKKAGPMTPATEVEKRSIRKKMKSIKWKSGTEVLILG